MSGSCDSFRAAFEISLCLSWGALPMRERMRQRRGTTVLSQRCARRSHKGLILQHCVAPGLHTTLSEVLTQVLRLPRDVREVVVAAEVAVKIFRWIQRDISH